MHAFSWIDWVVVAFPLLTVLYVGWRAQRHMKAVSDFTSGGRVANRYVICVASGEAAMGLISVVAMWEMYYKSGFSVSFWNTISAPIGLIMGLVGFCIYRFRETRCLTLAQFFEVRYSRGMRFYSGVISALSGVVNYAIFPAVGARFIMHFANLPQRTEIFGAGFSTYGLLLAICIGLAFAMVWFGGQLTLMCTDCVQGIFNYWMYLVIVVAVLCFISWEQISGALLSVPAPGQSLVHPFDNYELSDFNIYYVLIGVFGNILNRMSWQGASGYNSAAATPHEAKMANIMGTWRGGFSSMMIVLLAIVGFTYMNHPDFAPYAEKVNDALLANIDNPSIMVQMRVPMVMSNLLPVGVTGLFFASLILLMISTDNTYMHSWGTVIFQDCILPYTKKRLSPRTHIMGLRMSVLFVAVFAWLFSFYFGQTTYILMFFALTGTIYLGGAGPCILGGLYWKRGTAAGAYAALTAGGVLGVLGVLLSQPALWRPVARWLHEDCGMAFLAPYLREFPVNGQWLYFIAMLTGLLLYILVSLLTCRRPFDMDRMLHRGQYALAGEGNKAKLAWSLRSVLGITDEFTKGDKALTWSVFLYTTAMWVLFLAVVFLNLVFGFWSKEGWMQYFFITGLLLPAAIGLVSTVWFTIGGVWGLRNLFSRLKVLQRNNLDDGRVVGHVSAADLASGETGREALEAARFDRPRAMSRLFVASAAVLVAAFFLPWLSPPSPADLDAPPPVADPPAFDDALLRAARLTLEGGDLASDPAAGAALLAAAAEEQPEESKAPTGKPREPWGAWLSRQVPGAFMPTAKTLPGTLDIALARNRILYLEDAAEAMRQNEAKLLKDVAKKTGVLEAARRKAAALVRAEGVALPEGAAAPVYSPELVERLGGRLPPALEKEWREADIRLTHAVGAVRDNRTQQERHDGKLRSSLAAYNEQRGQPGRIMPATAWLLFLGPLLAAAALASHFRGRMAEAGKFGLAAALVNAAVLFAAMLAFPETLGSFIAPGVFIEALATFMLLACSSMALTAMREVGLPEANG